MTLKYLAAITASVLLAVSTWAASTSSFHADVSGAGSPIIFIPGLSCDGSVWTETVTRYTDSHQCHVLSLNGFGKQPAANHPTDFLQTVTDDLAAYIRKNNLHSPTIVGHSLGGFIALKLAIEHPDLPGSLLVVDSLPFLPAAMNPAATVENVTAQATAQRDQMASGGQNPAMLRMMLVNMITAESDIERAMAMANISDPATVAQAMFELNTADLRPLVSKIKARTIVLGAWFAYAQFGSTKDSTAAIFDSQYNTLPNYQLHMSERGKHFLMWDDPQLLHTHLDSLLKH